MIKDMNEMNIVLFVTKMQQIGSWHNLKQIIAQTRNKLHLLVQTLAGDRILILSD